MNQHASSDKVDLLRDQQRCVKGMLRTSWFDAVTSFLMALVLFLGTLVLLLIVVGPPHEIVRLHTVLWPPGSDFLQELTHRAWNLVLIPVER